VSTSQRLFIVVTVREGRVAGIADYTESEEALEAAGLSE
jgi:hypothetical protein